jgi:hypothetical protein
MTVQVAIFSSIVVNSVDLSNHCDSIKYAKKYADVDTTSFGQGAKTRVAGLGDHSLALTFHQDYAAGSVDATIFPLVGTTTSVTLKASTASTSTTNPAYTMVVLVDDWTPLDAKVGALLQSSVTWPVVGEDTRATS